MELHVRIQDILNQKEMTQAELGRAAQMSSAQISNVVSGATKNPHISTLVPIARALGTSLDYLVLGKIPGIESMDEGQADLNRHYESLNAKGRRRLLEEAEIMIMSGRFSC